MTLSDKHNIVVLTTTANGRLDLPKNETILDGVKVIYFPRWTKGNSHFSPTLLWHLWKTLKQYDAVHIHSWWNTISVLSLAICALKGVNPVLSPRGMLSKYTLSSTISKKIFHHVIGSSLLRKALLHATSSAEATDIRRLLPDAKVHTVFNLVNFAATLNRRATNRSEPLKLLFLSRIDPKKGLEILFEALAKITYPFQLTIAGTGNDEYVGLLQKKAERLAIAKYINWKGMINGNEKFELYAESDLFVLSSYNENFANVVIEALSVGTPVVLSDEVGTSDFVLKYNLGWVCPLNSDQLRLTLEKAFVDTDKRATIRKKAPEVIEQEFAKEVLIEKYLDMYKNSGNKKP